MYSPSSRYVYPTTTTAASAPAAALAARSGSVPSSWTTSGTAARSGCRQDVVETEERGDDVFDGGVHARPLDVAALESIWQVLGADHAVGHLDVESCVDRGRGVAQTEDPVADDEALESPLGAKDV